MPSTNRRWFLASLGAVTASLSGCTRSSAPGNGDDESPSSTPADTDESAATVTATPRTVRGDVGDTVAVDGMELTVENPRVRKLVVSQGPAHDWIRADDGQYLLLDVRGWERPDQPTQTPPPAPPDPFDPVDVVLDGRPRNPETVYELANVPSHQTPGSGETYQRYPADGTYVPGLAIPIPIAEPTTVAVRWAGEDRHALWELGAKTRERMARAPSFELTSLDVTTTDDGTVEIDVTVANSGDRAGTWFAWHSTRNFSGRYFHGMEVPAGETESLAVRPKHVEPGNVFQFETATTSHTERIPASESTTETA